jgi:hypothetical protein
MENHEFTAMQVTILVRTQPGGGQPVTEFFDSVNFQYQMQDMLGSHMKIALKEGGLDFEEVIVSLDNPAQKAERIRTKSGLIRRLFGDGS